MFRPISTVVCSEAAHTRRKKGKVVLERDLVVKKPGSYADLHNSFLINFFFVIFSFFLA